VELAKGRSPAHRKLREQIALIVPPKAGKKQSRNK
jgi:hypothetical protein